MLSKQEAFAGGALRDGFETRDFSPACFLRCTGYAVIGLRAEGQRKDFGFRDGPFQRTDVAACEGDGTSVPPCAFSSTIKDIQALLHNV